MSCESWMFACPKHTRIEETANMSRITRKVLRSTRQELICMLAQLDAKKLHRPSQYVRSQVECIRHAVLSLLDDTDSTTNKVFFLKILGANDKLVSIPFDVLSYVFEFVKFDNKLKSTCRTAYLASNSVRDFFCGDLDYVDYRLFGFPKRLAHGPEGILLENFTRLTGTIEGGYRGRANVCVSANRHAEISIDVGKTVSSLSLTISELATTCTRLRFRSPENIKHLDISVRAMRFASVEKDGVKTPMFPNLEALSVRRSLVFADSFRDDICPFPSTLRVLSLLDIYEESEFIGDSVIIGADLLTKLMKKLPCLEAIGDIPFQMIKSARPLWAAIAGHVSLKTVRLVKFRKIKGVRLLDVLPTNVTYVCEINRVFAREPFLVVRRSRVKRLKRGEYVAFEDGNEIFNDVPAIIPSFRSTTISMKVAKRRNGSKVLAVKKIKNSHIFPDNPPFSQHKTVLNDFRIDPV